MRARKGAARNKAKKRLFKAVEGFVGGRRRLLRTAKETLLRAGMFAFRDRRAKKRDFRRLFIIRLTAAAEMRGLRYSRLIHGLRLAKIGSIARASPSWRSTTPRPSTRSSPRSARELDKHDADRPRPADGEDGLSRAARGSGGNHDPSPRVSIARMLAVIGIVGLDCGLVRALPELARPVWEGCSLSAWRCRSG